MKIAVVAAHGKSGKAFVKAALAEGHEVRAGIRGRNPFADHPRLKVLECDGLNKTQMTNLLKDCEAVVCLIGHSSKSPRELQTDTIKNVHAAMREHGITRLISLTGSGARQPKDCPSWLDRILNFTIAKIDPARIQDGIDHLEYLQTTELDWTVLRVLKLTGGGAASYNLTLRGPASLFVSRATVARAILLMLENNTFIQQTPITS